MAHPSKLEGVIQNVQLVLNEKAETNKRFAKGDDFHDEITKLINNSGLSDEDLQNMYTHFRRYTNGAIKNAIDTSKEAPTYVGVCFKSDNEAQACAELSEMWIGYYSTVVNIIKRLMNSRKVNLPDDKHDFSNPHVRDWFHMHNAKPKERRDRKIAKATANKSAKSGEREADFLRLCNDTVHTIQKKAVDLPVHIHDYTLMRDFEKMFRTFPYNMIGTGKKMQRVLDAIFLAQKDSLEGLEKQYPKLYRLVVNEEEWENKFDRLSKEKENDDGKLDWSTMRLKYVDPHSNFQQAKKECEWRRFCREFGYILEDDIAVNLLEVLQMNTTVENPEAQLITKMSQLDIRTLKRFYTRREEIAVRNESKNFKVEYPGTISPLHVSSQAWALLQRIIKHVHDHDKAGP